MKRQFLLLLWSVVFWTMIPNFLMAQDKWDGETIATKFFSGTGTKSDPYIIRTGSECAYFLSQIKNGNSYEGKYIRLGNDIIFNNYKTSGTFAGDFDGNKHFLSNVLGPFIYTLSGKIHDLKIGIVSGDYGTASIVGTNTGHIYNCFVTTNASPYISGLAALAVSNSGVIEDCYAIGRIYGRGEYGLGNNVAALVYNNSGTLQNCASEVKVYNYSGGDKSSQMTYTNTGSVINCIQGTNNITTMFDVSGTTCTIEYVDSMHFVNIASITATKGQNVGSLPNPNYDCTFIGWYRNGQIVKATDVVDNNWTLFAKWEQRIQKQPTKNDMSIRVDDSQHATFKWYKQAMMPILFADWQSTNHGRETTSSQTYTFENCKDRVLSFHYDVSSESSDPFTATLNGTILVNIGGKYSKSYSYEIPDNGQYTLTLSYSKDDSESEGKDMVTVSDIMVSPVSQLVASNVTSIQVNPATETVYYCKVTYSNSSTCLTSDYVQFTPTSMQNIAFADANVKTICVANWDTDGDGELSYTEAAAVTDLSKVFKNNKQITSFDELQYFTGLASIGEDAFYMCSGLTSVTLPNGVTSIGDYALSGCSSLTSVTIPNSVTSIDDFAFYNCSGLTTVTIPNSVTSLGNYIFSECSSLASITVDSDNTVYDSRDNCNAIIETSTNTLIIGCKSTVIPNSVTSIGDFAFYQCSSLTSVTIPNSVTSIGYSAFSGCSGLTSVTIPNSVRSIDYFAFYCSGLTSATIPNSVTSISDQAFSGCSGLTSITVDSDNTVYDSRDNCNAIIKTSTNTLITGCKSTIIPNSVTSIGDCAFSRCSGLTSVTIPNSVTSIGGSAFYYCSGLTSVIIPNSVTSIGMAAFEDCSGLTSVISEIEEPFAFGNYAFKYIASTCTLTVPYGTRDAYIAAGWTENVFKGGIVEAEPPYYQIIYKIDDVIYKTYEVAYGTSITPEADPTKEGYSFSGWSGIPATMPANDVTVTGSFTINKYKLTYMVDGETYKAYEVEYGANIIPEAEPSKEGYMFSGWSEIPAVMPCYDVTVTGLFSTTENVLSIKSKEVFIGRTASFPVELTNKKDVSAFEFDLYLPEGITLTGCELTDRKGRDHTSSFSVQSEGKYKVVAYSASSKAFSGTEGAIVNLMLDVREDMAVGEYIVNIKNIELTLSDATPVTPADISAKLTVSDIKPGDVNGSGKVTISDVVAIVNHVIGRTPANFVAAAADVNGDGVINVFDVTKTVNIILGIDGEEAKMRDAVDAIGGMMTMERKGDGMNLIVEKPANYIAMQFDVIVPESSSLQDVKLNGCADHALAFDRTGENRYTVIAYSMNNAAFEAAEDALVTLQLSDAKAASIENAAFVTTDGRCVKMDVSDMETGIQSVDNSKLTVDSDAIYTLSGQCVTMDKKALPKGVYIQNGRKFVVK